MRIVDHRPNQKESFLHSEAASRPAFIKSTTASSPATRRWCSGIISDSHSEVRGSIPRRRMPNFYYFRSKWKRKLRGGVRKWRIVYAVMASWKFDRLTSQRLGRCSNRIHRCTGQSWCHLRVIHGSPWTPSWHQTFKERCIFLDTT